MSASGDKYAAIRGHFPGEEEHVMPSLVDRLVTAGVVTPPDPALLQKISQASGGPAPSVASSEPPATAPTMAPATAPTVAVQAAAPKPATVAPASTAPAQPKPAAAPAAAASGPVSSQRQTVAASKKDVDDALSGLFASREDSKLMSAVPAGPLSSRISKKLPAIGDPQSVTVGDAPEDDGDEYAGAMRGGDEELPDEGEDDFEVVVEEPAHAPEPVAAKKAPAPVATPAPAPSVPPAPKPAQSVPPQAAPKPAAEPPKTETYAGRIAPSTKIMTDENIEDLLAGATGPTLKDFKESGLADDWFGDPEFTSGKDSFDDIIGSGLDGSAPAPAAPAYVPEPVAAKPMPAAAPPAPPAPKVYQEVETVAHDGPSDEEAADDLLADLGLTSSSTTQMKAASSPQVTGKPYDKFDAVAVDQLESAADDLLRDIATHLKSKGLDTPPKLQKRLDVAAAPRTAGGRERQEEQLVITEEEPVALAPSPAVESRASMPSPPRVAATASPSPRAIPVAPQPTKPADAPKATPSRDVPKDSTIDMGTVARKRAAEAEVTPEDTFGETIEKAKDATAKKTLILTREEMDKAGKQVVGVQELSAWKVYVGAAGIVLLLSAGIIMAMFYSFTGKF